MSNLILCSGCQRHVRGEEIECPFCHAAITPEAREAGARPLPPAGVPRAKLYAVSAAVVAGVAAVACGGDDTTGTTSQSGGASGTAQAGGASGTGQAAGAAGDAVADSGATGGQGGTVADAKVPQPDVPIALPYGCVFPDPSRTTKV